MLVTWARGTDWTNVFPLYISTVFKINFEVSIKKITHLDNFDVQERL
jgi:hypothetical protein